MLLHAGCRVLGEAALQRKDQRHRMLRDGIGVDAGSTGEADAVRAQDVAVVLVDAGADRLDELELLAMSTCSFFHSMETTSTSASGSCRAQLSGERTSRGDAGIAPREPLGDAIGAMGKADGEMIFRRVAFARSSEHAQRKVAQQKLLKRPLSRSRFSAG